MTSPRAAPYPAYLTFSTTAALISGAIRSFTKSQVSHVSVRHWSEDFQDWYVYEAIWSGFRVVPAEVWRADGNLVVQEFSIPIPKCLWRDVGAWLGTSYDYAGIGKFLLRSLMVWRGAPTPKRVLCSEVWVRFLPQLFPGLDPEWATPNDMLLALRKLIETNGGTLPPVFDLSKS